MEGLNCTLQTDDSERRLVRTWTTSTASTCLSRLTKLLVYNTCTQNIADSFHAVLATSKQLNSRHTDVSVTCTNHKLVWLCITVTRSQAKQFISKTQAMFSNSYL